MPTAFSLRGGGTMFSLRATIAQVIHSDRPISRPGAMPAMNSLEIETFAATPKITRPIDGGRIGAITPADAINPAARCGA